MTAISGKRSAFDRCVGGAIGLHLLADVAALLVAIQAAILLEYAVIRLLELPLVLLMLLIYQRARRR